MLRQPAQNEILLFCINENTKLQKKETNCSLCLILDQFKIFFWGDVQQFSLLSQIHIVVIWCDVTSDTWHQNNNMD